MGKDNGTVVCWKITSGILLVLLIGSIAFSISNLKKIETIKEIAKEEPPIARIATNFQDWGENMNQDDEYILRYWVSNFGDTEAKDVVVQCIITDKNDNIIKRVNKTLGSLSSGSMEYDEMYENVYEDTTEYSAFCFTKSCSNCENLDMKIDDLQEYI